jgi:hypothetical protein
MSALPHSDRFLRRSEMTLSAISGLMHRSKKIISIRSSRRHAVVEAMARRGRARLGGLEIDHQRASFISASISGGKFTQRGTRGLSYRGDQVDNQVPEEDALQPRSGTDQPRPDPAHIEPAGDSRQHAGAAEMRRHPEREVGGALCPTHGNRLDGGVVLQTGGGFFMSKRKSGGRAAKSHLYQ